MQSNKDDDNDDLCLSSLLVCCCCCLCYLLPQVGTETWFMCSERRRHCREARARERFFESTARRVRVWCVVTVRLMSCRRVTDSDCRSGSLSFAIAIAHRARSQTPSNRTFFDSSFPSLIAHHSLDIIQSSSQVKSNQSIKIKIFLTSALLRECDSFKALLVQ